MRGNKATPEQCRDKMEGTRGKRILYTKEASLRSKKAQTRGKCVIRGYTGTKEK